MPMLMYLRRVFHMVTDTTNHAKKRTTHIVRKLNAQLLALDGMEPCRHTLILKWEQKSSCHPEKICIPHSLRCPQDSDLVSYTQLVRLLVSARAYQPANSVFLSQQTSTSQPRNQSANMLTNSPDVARNT